MKLSVSEGNVQNSVFFNQNLVAERTMFFYIRLVTKPTKWMCAQQRLRSAWASAQSDQSLRCVQNG